MNITLRQGRPEDAQRGGLICYEAFKALADATRRLLLDRLFKKDGQTLTELDRGLSMTRFGTMKHLRILENAGAR